MTMTEQQIEKGQCDACPDFCVESWRWEQYLKQQEQG